ncbi:hypothetical protein SAMN05421854_104115 [Amycolatopsis rubida]|uniref:Uncharacterized protein n=1 Tax=Amycolatopsis rubida TaxID=112413 RepID=A0A1I5MQP8_9PSEU|nr:hypothetical protein SAMN05421854_104115 [Amycolatopsis rubida]
MRQRSRNSAATWRVCPADGSQKVGCFARRLEAGRSCGMMADMTAISVIIALRAG